MRIPLGTYPPFFSPCLLLLLLLFFLLFVQSFFKLSDFLISLKRLRNEEVQLVMKFRFDGINQLINMNGFFLFWLFREESSS